MGITIKQHVDYWLKGSAENMADMRSNVKSNRRVIALFCGHLALEKMLKALCAVRNIQIGQIHKLADLADSAGLNLSLTQRAELISITGLNIAARYDDYKMIFHKQCTPQYTAIWVKCITAWYKQLKPMSPGETRNPSVTRFFRGYTVLFWVFACHV